MKSGMAKAIIMAVKDVHLALVQRASSAKEDLDSLKRVHVQAGYAKTVAAACRAHLHQGQRESLQAYFARMYALNDELIACGSRPDDEEVVMLLQEGLPGRGCQHPLALTVMSTRDMNRSQLTRS
jgi:hypothetical protein